MASSTAAVTPLPAPGPITGPKFKKDVPMTPPLTAFDPAYLSRKEACCEKIHTLQSGKQLSYFTEGSVESSATVVCFPSAGFGKWEFVPRDPLEGAAQSDE